MEYPDKKESSISCIKNDSNVPEKLYSGAIVNYPVMMTREIAS
jgi:hypothetical protein